MTIHIWLSHTPLAVVSVSRPPEHMLHTAVPRSHLYGPHIGLPRHMLTTFAPGLSFAVLMSLQAALASL